MTRNTEVELLPAQLRGLALDVEQLLLRGDDVETRRCTASRSACQEI